MDIQHPFLLIFFLFSFNLTLLNCHVQFLPNSIKASHIQTYIVRVIKPEGTKLDDNDLENWHKSFIPNTTLDSGEPRLVYSYHNVISGFAARLTRKEVMAMKFIDGFVSAQPDSRYRVQTTYTPDYLGLRQWDSGAWASTLWGAGMIVGIIDTGILPTHPSFGDDGMPPPPIKWKGHCDFINAGCNNKIIGATGFYNGNRTSPMDEDGHGCHVASIAAGNFVDGAHVLGNAKGTAAGMAPKAHLAMYRVCHSDGCRASDILAGFDGAIGDRVDVISVSIGGRGPMAIYKDYIMIGSLAAVESGIVPIVSAGNEGPLESSVAHDAPWALVVGASSTDRRIRATVKLGNGRRYKGESGYQPKDFSPILRPIAYPAMYNMDALYCKNGTLDRLDLRGKIVVCWGGHIEPIEKGQVVKNAGGAAMILINAYENQYTTSSDPHVLPVSNVNFIDGNKILFHVYFSNSSPAASIHFSGTTWGAHRSPAVASFSARGPSKKNGGILKPDIIAPGVNILAAWPIGVGPEPDAFAKSTFNFKSGSSMSAPHVAGIVALVKSKYPDWSSAKIQSAIITSAIPLGLNDQPITDDGDYKQNASFFAMGAGHVNSTRAMDPGLVYDVRIEDYVGYLCGLGYKDSQVMTIIRRPVQCSSISAIDAAQLNYPSISVFMNSTTSRPMLATSTKTISRTVTNVGMAKSIYWAKIDEPAGVSVSLSKYQLQFSRLNQEISFDITFSVKYTAHKGKVSEGQLSWVSDKYVVRSPVIVTFT